MRPLFLDRISCVCFFFITLAPAEAGRVKVALLDGDPVYHWTNFPSARQNHVDRALILRDFRLQGFHLPEHFVDEALQKKVDKDYGGDRAKVTDALKRSGETMADYRKYTAEEVILEAMRVRMTQPPPPERQTSCDRRRVANVPPQRRAHSDDPKQSDEGPLNSRRARFKRRPCFPLPVDFCLQSSDLHFSLSDFSVSAFASPAPHHGQRIRFAFRNFDFKQYSNNESSGAQTAFLSA